MEIRLDEEEVVLGHAVTCSSFFTTVFANYPHCWTPSLRSIETVNCH